MARWEGGSNHSKCVTFLLAVVFVQPSCLVTLCLLAQPQGRSKGVYWYCSEAVALIVACLMVIIVSMGQMIRLLIQVTWSWYSWKLQEGETAESRGKTRRTATVSREELVPHRAAGNRESPPPCIWPVIQPQPPSTCREAGHLPVCWRTYQVVYINLIVPCFYAPCSTEIMMISG